jgi:hypothetical protein
MEGDSHRYRERTRVTSRVEPSAFSSSCQTHVVSGKVAQVIECGGARECTAMPCVPSKLIP